MGGKAHRCARPPCPSLALVASASTHRVDAASRGRATTVRAIKGPQHDWLTAAGRSASDHPMLPNKRTVERRHHSAKDDANDDPGPQIWLLDFVDPTHRELVLLRSRRLRVT